MKELVILVYEKTGNSYLYEKEHLKPDKIKEVKSLKFEAIFFNYEDCSETQKSLVSPATVVLPPGEYQISVVPEKCKKNYTDIVNEDGCLKFITATL